MESILSVIGQHCRVLSATVALRHAPKFDTYVTVSIAPMTQVC
jgi:hypothetical protein